MNTASPYHLGLEAAYQGEIFGMTMYRRIAEARHEPHERAKWQVLVRLEEVTRSVLEPVLRRHGMDIDPKPESLRAGEDEAVHYANLPWDQLMRRFSDELDADIEEYSALLDIAPEPDRVAIRYLLDHEIVTKVFCEDELAGRQNLSIAPVQAFIARGEA